MVTQVPLRSAEISDLIKEKIKKFDQNITDSNQGIIVSLADGIVRIQGLDAVKYGERLEFDNGVYGIALNLEQDSVGAVVLGDTKFLDEGQRVRCTGEVLSVPVGPQLLGRVVDALGRPIDGQGSIATTEMAPIEKVAPGVIWRESVRQPLQTGLKPIDVMVPIGRGQRELIIGDRQTGKTAIAIDTIINQKGTGVKCIYVAVGQKSSSVASVVQSK